jgi:hypothetical protein
MSVASEINFGVYNTRRNLPAHVGCRRGEANFVGAFLKTFMAKAPAGSWCGRQFPVPDCGVADCIVFRLDGDVEAELAMGHLMAFEAKLLDWRKALNQAHRYRYYADVSIVILPAQAARPAIENRDLFQQMGVGLWTFNPESGAICSRIAVKAPAPLSTRKREQALLRIERSAFQLRKLRKQPEALEHRGQVVAV